MFISPAFAQSAGGGLGGIAGILPFVLIFAVFYFLLIRPQQRRQKMHRESLNAIRRGDKVVTGGGIIGTVTKVSGNDELVVEIAEGLKVRVLRGLVSQVLTKPEPASASGQASGQDGGQGIQGFLGKLFGGGR
jgi:preprotein translocase subunit YajC